MKLLILLITSALLGSALALPVERQELLNEVLEALAQEDTDLVSAEHYQLADTESELAKENELANVEEDDELADMEEDDKLADMEEDDELADMEDYGELADMEDFDELADMEDFDELADMEDFDKLADMEDFDKLADVEDFDKLADMEDLDKLADIEEDDEQADKEEDDELTDALSEEELDALVQTYLGQLEQSADIESLLGNEASSQFFRRIRKFAKKTYNKAKKGIKKGISFVGKAFKKAKDIAKAIWKYRGLVKCVPRNFDKSKRAQTIKKSVLCAMRELKKSKSPREVTVQFLEGLAHQVEEQGGQLTSAQDALIAAVTSSIEKAEALEQAATASQSEEVATDEGFAVMRYYKKAKKIARKLAKYKKYLRCARIAKSGNTSRAIQCIMQMSQQSSKPTFLEEMMNRVDLQD